MSYEVFVHPQVIKFLKKLPKHDVKRIREKISELTEPRFVRSIKIKGKEDVFRVRVGDYRILYKIDDSKKIVIVFKVDKRERVYDRL